MNVEKYTYEVGHTCDQLGGLYPCAKYEAAASYDEAWEMAQQRTAAGQCGFIRRSDGKIQAPDGSWIA